MAISTSTQVAMKLATKAAKLASSKAARQTVKRLRARQRKRASVKRRRMLEPQQYTFRRNTAPVSFANGFGARTFPVRIKQQEIIGSVTTLPYDTKKRWFWQTQGNPNDFHVLAFPLNPANPATFPWLSNIAKLFDKYKFNSLKFTFQNNVSTITDGEVAMAVDFDTLDKEPQNMVALSQLTKFESGSPFVRRTINIPVNHPGTDKFLYTYDAQSTKNDLKTYNMGTLFVGTQGCAKSNEKKEENYDRVLGRLIVEYDVTLLDKSYVSPSAKVSTLDQYSGSYDSTYVYSASSGIDGKVIGNLDLTQPDSTSVEIINREPINAGDRVTLAVWCNNVGNAAVDPVDQSNQEYFDWKTVMSDTSRTEFKSEIQQAVAAYDVPANTVIYGFGKPSAANIAMLASINSTAQAEDTTYD